MKIEFDIVNPNLYVFRDGIYFGMDNSDIIEVCKSVNEIIKNHIGELKVRELSINTIRDGESKGGGGFTISLEKYLDVLREDAKYTSGINAVTKDSARLFGLSYVVEAQTTETAKPMNDWDRLQKLFQDPNKHFDNFEQSYICKLDRKRTLERMEKIYKELDPKIPDNTASLNVITGQIPYTEKTLQEKNMGVVSLYQFKAKDKTQIEETKTKLVERLKDVGGPCLSLDAPEIFRQVKVLYNESGELINQYGDILKSPNWKTRLFRLDP